MTTATKEELTQNDEKRAAGDSRILLIDPELLDFVPAKLNHSDGVLIDMCRRFVNERVGQIMDAWDVLAKEFTVRGSGTKLVMVVPVTGLPGPGDGTPGPGIFLIPGVSDTLVFATGTRGSRTNELVELKVVDEPWMLVNFQALARAFEQLKNKAQKMQREALRQEQVAAINALRHGKAVLR